MKEKRITIRLSAKLDSRINKKMKSGKFMKKSELIREALWFGLNHMDRQKD